MKKKDAGTRMYNRKTLLAYIGCQYQVWIKIFVFNLGENCNTYKCIDGKEKLVFPKFIFVLSIVLDNNGVNSYTCSHCTVTVIQWCQYGMFSKKCKCHLIFIVQYILIKINSDHVFHIYLAMSCQFKVIW